VFFSLLPTGVWKSEGHGIGMATGKMGPLSDQGRAQKQRALERREHYINSATLDREFLQPHFVPLLGLRCSCCCVVERPFVVPSAIPSDQVSLTFFALFISQSISFVDLLSNDKSLLSIYTTVLSTICLASLLHLFSLSHSLQLMAPLRSLFRGQMRRQIRAL
jgi:hypothetical protein